MLRSRMSFVVLLLCLTAAVAHAGPVAPEGQPFTLTSGDFSVRVNPRWGWGVDLIKFRGQTVSQSNGAYSFVARFADNVYVGGPHVKPEREAVQAVSMTVDGKTIDPVKDRPTASTGQAIIYSRTTRLRGLEVTETIRLLPDHLERSAALTVKEDSAVNLVFPLMYVWPTSTSEWLAQTRDGSIREGQFTSDGGWQLQDDVLWCGLFDPKTSRAMVTAFPADLMKGVGRKHAYWDHKAYHKQYYQAMGVRSLKTGEAFTFASSLYGFEARPENWKQTVREAMAKRTGQAPVGPTGSTPPAMNAAPTGSCDDVVTAGKTADSEWMRKIRDKFNPRLSDKQPEWLKNPVALRALDPDTVLKPWTPVAAEEKSVKVWGRQYTIGPWGLPKQVQTRQAEIFAGEPRLILRLAGRSEPVTPNAAVLADTHRGVARYASNAFTSQGWFQAVTSYEYDGFCRFDLTMGAPGHNLDVEQLEWVVPLKAEHVKFIHNANAWQIGGATQAISAYYGALPQKDGEIFASDFKPMIWIGDYERGFCWFSESRQYWYPEKNEKSIRLVRKGNIVELHIAMITQPTRIRKLATLSFGINATPVKPVPTDWRGWRFTTQNAGIRASEMNPHVGNHAIFWQDGYRIITIYPVAKDDAMFKQDNEHLRGLGVQRIYPYVDLTLFGAQGKTTIAGEDFEFKAPEWTRFGDDWKLLPELMHRKEYQHVSMASSWQDFLLYEIKNWIVNCKANGIYLDEIFPQPDQRADHGMGYVDTTNTRRPTYAVYAMRDFFKRLAYLFQEHADGPPAILAHMSACMMVPYLSFADIMLDGEQYYHYVKKWNKDTYPSYIDMVSMDKYHALSRGEAYGLVPMLLPEFRPDALSGRFADILKQAKPTREMLAQTLLCDMLVWPIWCNAEAVYRTQQAKEAYGISRPETAFTGYWRTDRPSPQVTGDVLVSYYTNDNGVLAVVANLGAGPATTTLDWSRLELKPKSGDLSAWDSRDAETNQALGEKASTVTLDVAARDFRIVRFGPRS